MLVYPVIRMESNHQQQQEPTHPKENSGATFVSSFIYRKQNNYIEARTSEIQ